MALLVSDKQDFKAKKITDRDGHNIMIKGSSHQETAISSNQRAAKHHGTERRKGKIYNYSERLQHLFLNC